MQAEGQTSWRRGGARLRTALAAAALAGFFATGLRQTRAWILSFHARAEGPLATFDELLEPLGMPSPAAAVAEAVAEAPPHTAIAFVGEGPKFPHVLAVVNVLSYPRPFVAWECIHPAAPALSYYGWGTTQPYGIVFVHRPHGLAQRHATRWLSPRLLALRRPERFPPPERLCENVPEPPDGAGSRALRRRGGGAPPAGGR